jgi:hypothetical protein
MHTDSNLQCLAQHSATLLLGQATRAAWPRQSVKRVNKHKAAPAAGWRLRPTARATWHAAARALPPSPISPMIVPIHCCSPTRHTLLGQPQCAAGAHETALASAALTVQPSIQKSVSFTGRLLKHCCSPTCRTLLGQHNALLEHETALASASSGCSARHPEVHVLHRPTMTSTQHALLGRGTKPSMQQVGVCIHP